MPLPRPLEEQLEDLLSRQHGSAVRVMQAFPVYGGSINEAYRLETSAGAFFVKVNAADRFPSLFRSEAHGLQLLRNAAALRVPEVLAHGEAGGSTFLLMEYIAPGEEDRDFQGRLGRLLAKLHRQGGTSFGLDRDNYIGALPQVNTPCPDWSEFFMKCRLEPLVKMARDHGRIHAGDVLRFERLYGRLPALFPTEKPALLHGDLWKNNYLAAVGGQPVLIDPAVYYRHREMDLAMTLLFGGFHRDFYEAYQEELPLQPDWRQRTGLCNLYPLLVHLNLFGGSYAGRVGAVLREYT